MMRCKCGGTLEHKRTIPSTTTSFEEMVYQCDRCKATEVIRILGGPDYCEKAITALTIDFLSRTR
jgi:hypothetical protein